MVFHVTPQGRSCRITKHTRRLHVVLCHGCVTRSLWCVVCSHPGPPVQYGGSGQDTEEALVPCHWISVSTFCPALFLICTHGYLKRSFVSLDGPDGMTISGVRVDRLLLSSQSRKRLCQLKWTGLYFWVFSLQLNNNLLLIISCWSVYAH